MTRHLPPIRFQRKRDADRSTQIVLVVLVCLIVLFLALNFVWAQQIESIGRDVQEQTAELAAEERMQDALLAEISEAGSQSSLALEAWRLGYRPRIPIYLPLARESIEGSGSGAEGGADPRADSLWDLVTEPFAVDVP
jgi:Tfp pilus assembly protein PilO